MTSLLYTTEERSLVLQLCDTLKTQLYSTATPEALLTTTIENTLPTTLALALKQQLLPLSAGERAAKLTSLQKEFSNIPVATLYLAYQPTYAQLVQLTELLRSALAQPLIVEQHLDTKNLGITIEFAGKRYQRSLLS